jgi:iron complex outermembrane receptor protein
VLAVDARAQAASGTVSGRVVLTDGAPVHGATIVIVGARRTATSGEDGRFEIAAVPAGTYEVIAQREHFAASRQTITVGAGTKAAVEFVLAPAAIHEELTVTASPAGLATTFEAFNSIRSLDSVELAKHRGATIADALTSVPGVSIRSFGAGSARPVIRGFDGDRVLIMQDGVRTGDLSSQSGDHGVSIDPAGLDRIEVVKGPATLLYGSNAVGGVVNAITPQEAFRSAPFSGLLGGVSVDGGSANAQAGIYGDVQFGRGPWLVWAGGGSRRTGDYDTPAGAIENSATRMTTGRFGIGWTGTRAFFSVGTQLEDNRFGIPFAGLFHAHEHEEEGGEEEEEAEEHELQVDIKSDRREFRADAGMRNFTGGFLDTLRLTFGYTDYGHDEIEIAEGTEVLGTAFKNETANLRVELEQKRQGRLTGRMGIQWFGRDYSAAGEEALAPPTTQSSFSAFGYEELSFGAWRTQFGLRIERNAYEVGARPEHEEEEGEEEEHEPPAARNRSFTGVSGSVGLHADLGASSAFVVNLSKASRAPALEELYNFGPHVGNLAFEIGNPDLEREETVGLDLSLRTRAARVRGEVNFYVYDIDNFVFLDFTGEEEHGLREAEFLQGDSRFVGWEASANIDLGGRAHANVGVAGVRAKLTGTDEFLPRIPPLSARFELEVPWRGFSISPEIVLNGRQRDVFRDETTTASSAIVNLRAAYFVVRGHATHGVTLTAYNLGNRDYRLHTSFIKDLAPEMGRGVRVTYTVRFF